MVKFIRMIKVQNIYKQLMQWTDNSNENKIIREKNSTYKWQCIKRNVSQFFKGKDITNISMLDLGIKMFLFIYLFYNVYSSITLVITNNYSYLHFLKYKRTIVAILIFFYCFIVFSVFNHFMTIHYFDWSFHIFKINTS